METWKQITRFPSYAISSAGRVKRIADCPRSGHKAGRILKPDWVGRPGKKRECVRLAKGPGGRPLVHQLVMWEFGPPSPGSEYIIAHEDGNERNNAPSNLKWKTAKENTADRVRHGTDMRGEQCKQHRLSREDVLEILSTPKERGYITALSTKFGVDRTTVSKVVNGVNWSHLRSPR